MFKWFSKKKEEKPAEEFNDEKPSARPPKSSLRIKKRMTLPRHFAKKVIDLELQCGRGDVTKDNVNSLMDLYTVNHLINILLFSWQSSTTTVSVILTTSSTTRISCTPS